MTPENKTLPGFETRFDSKFQNLAFANDRSPSHRKDFYRAEAVGFAIISLTASVARDQLRHIVLSKRMCSSLMINNSNNSNKRK